MAKVWSLSWEEQVTPDGREWVENVYSHRLLSTHQYSDTLVSI